MNAAVISKAVFLLRDAHLSPLQARRGLAAYFPGLGMTDRVRHVQAAYDIVSGGRPAPRAKASDLTQPRYFAAAHERHGFTD
ncbi:hypothetical protein [Streptomyces monomycini]|uniref:hypothetical protein n=1 Tax=Streptomyces monomycini TaxID=371720 RepID=UPI0012FE9025|nr:hypothetical protein [Streptomyces monomycini]